MSFETFLVAPSALTCWPWWKLINAGLKGQCFLILSHIQIKCVSPCCYREESLQYVHVPPWGRTSPSSLSPPFSLQHLLPLSALKEAPLYFLWRHFLAQIPLGSQPCWDRAPANVSPDLGQSFSFCHSASGILTLPPPCWEVPHLSKAIPSFPAGRSSGPCLGFPLGSEDSVPIPAVPILAVPWAETSQLLHLEKKWCTGQYLSFYNASVPAEASPLCPRGGTEIVVPLVAHRSKEWKEAQDGFVRKAFSALLHPLSTNPRPW